MTSEPVEGPTYFASAAQWREWLEAHHEDRTECLVGFIRVTTAAPNMSWSDAVDEALCFGWIDGVRRRVDETRYSIRFTPRKPASTWSAVNVGKVETLRAAGLLRPAGQRAFDQRRPERTGIYSFEREQPAELAPEEDALLRDNDAAWAFFTAQPPWYRRTALHWVVSAKRPETRARRLATLIEDFAAGRRLRQHRFDQPR